MVRPHCSLAQAPSPFLSSHTFHLLQGQIFKSGPNSASDHPFVSTLDYRILPVFQSIIQLYLSLACSPLLTHHIVNGRWRTTRDGFVVVAGHALAGCVRRLEHTSFTSSKHARNAWRKQGQEAGWLQRCCIAGRELAYQVTTTGALGAKFRPGQSGRRYDIWPSVTCSS